MAIVDTDKDTMYTPISRASYPHLAKPQKVSKDSDRVVYSMRLLIPKVGATARDKQALKGMQKMAENAAKETFGKKWDEVKLGMRDGDNDPKLKKAEENHGNWIVELKSYDRPIGCGKFVNGKVVEIKPDEIYAGCYVIACVNCYTYDMDKNQGVSFGVRSIVFAKDGTPFVTTGDPATDFEGIDPTQFGIENSEMFDEEDDDDIEV